MRVEVRLADDSDPEWFAPRLRAADRAELEAATGPDMLAILRDAIARSGGRAFTAVAGDEPISLFGFAPFHSLSDTAAPWMVGTDTLPRYGGALNRFGRAYCAAALGEFRRLVNYVDVRNEISVRWLKRLGFTMGPPQPFGVQGLPFMRFEMRGDDV